MNIVTEANISGKAITDKPHKRPVRMLRWFIIVGLLLTAVGDLAAVHQVNVTSDVNGRITDIMFTAGSTVTAGTPLVQLFDGPDQGDLASFKAQATVAQLSLDRAKQLAARQFSPQATVDSAQAAFDQAQAGIAKTEAIIAQ